ncbi:alpha-crystallin [mine drainage metagenome]|uniref:Alpha-crystallin n=1 Tax=mine drainage metagenome TaxID=410659 RepID=A0A1J5QUS1_9ZZZZ
MTMNVKSLMPWNRGKLPGALFEDGSPFLTLHREMNRLFDDMLHGVDRDLPSTRLGWGTAMPRLDLHDGETEVSLTAELPGLEAKDVQITLRDGVLTLKGEKKAETTQPHYSERWFGQFQRSVALGPDVDADKVTATFKDGVLTVTAAKKPGAADAEKQIPITS